jgi:hypothetical protein
METSSHAAVRMNQQRISRQEVELVIEHGTRVHNAGALFFFMGKRDLPETLSAADRERLEGLTVVSSPDKRIVITVYKNRRAIRDIKRKPKYSVRCKALPD